MEGGKPVSRISRLVDRSESTRDANDAAAAEGGGRNYNCQIYCHMSRMGKTAKPPPLISI